MHYYKKNLGDYYKKAGRLSILQHGAYTLLIDACYDRERFPTKAEAIDWLWASTAEEIAAVEFILAKFFVFEDGVYTQSRIKEEIDKYHENASINKRIAIEREKKRKEKSTKRERSVNEAPPNQEPRTINQEPMLKDIAQHENVIEPAGTLPTNKKGEEFPVYQTDIDLWTETYPAVNVIAELKKIRAWLDANPAKKKTKSGMKRFINSWMAREQNR